MEIEEEKDSDEVLWEHQGFGQVGDSGPKKFNEIPTNSCQTKQHLPQCLLMAEDQKN